MFLQIVINGLTQGCVYALIALGYSMVYGTLRFINFAHGDTYMWGACFALLFARMHIPFIPALLLTMICTGLLSVTIEFLCYRRLRNVPIQNDTSCNKFCWGGISLKKTMYHAREQTQ